MSPLDAIRRHHAELTAFRRDLHANPELGMAEHRTAEKVATALEALGIEVHRGVGGTGVVGVLRSGRGNRAIGLRADMDALPLQELNDVPYRSTTPGVMHACGHDGHTTMLLGAAKYLAETKNFDGIVHFIFQPGEEGCGGALAMLEDRLFERFPCDAIYAMHNRPGLPVGKYSVRSGPTAAGGAFFDIAIGGKGAHGARPETSIDPVLAACHVTAALQSIVSRNIAPGDQAVVSVTKVVGGDAYNVIPETATISGTARFFSREVSGQIEAGLRRVAEGVAAGFGATANLDYRLIFAPTINDPEQADAFAAAMEDLVGPDAIVRDTPPGMGSEDFSFMMEKVPGAYVHVGNGDGAMPHNPRYQFNDEAIPYGSALFARIVERGLPGGG
jgi:hippurate hydrolase